MVNSTSRSRVVVIGGGTAGLTVAARLRRAGQEDVTVVEPSDKHYYQPLWTLVGGGRAPLAASVRPAAAVMPRGVRWVRAAAREIDPDNRTVGLSDGQVLGYDYLVVCPGLCLDWDRLPGSAETLGHGGGFEQLPVRPGPEDVGDDPGDEERHGGVHHAVGPDQMRRRTAEDRLPGR